MTVHRTSYEYCLEARDVQLEKKKKEKSNNQVKNIFELI